MLLVSLQYSLQYKAALAHQDNDHINEFGASYDSVTLCSFFYDWTPNVSEHLFCTCISLYVCPLFCYYRVCISVTCDCVCV